MGGAASVAAAEAEAPPEQIPLLKLPEAIEDSLYVHERFPLIIDPTEQAHRFLKYQPGSYFNADDPVLTTKANLHRALLSCMQYGRCFTICINSFDHLNPESIFERGIFPIEVLNRNAFFQPEIWQSVVAASSNPEHLDMNISAQFSFVICTSQTRVPSYLSSVMHIVPIVVNSKAQTAKNSDESSAEMDAIESLYNAKEIVRNSVEMVESAFEGATDEVLALLDKGYHIESSDGRNHTCLSEAASQGHLALASLLLDRGANPNALSDTGRSPLWRAAFNAHAQMVALLLEAGGSPMYMDKVSMESAFDVAASDDCRDLLRGWDISRTTTLMEAREKAILAQFESRIRTVAEREMHAKNLLRLELVGKAAAGDVDGVKALLFTSVDEALVENSRPRVSAESRNDLGQSVLSIAAQFDHVSLASLLLSHTKQGDSEEASYTDDDKTKMMRKVFNSNANSRDLKGWTCVAVAVFHHSLRVLRLLLENGGDPSIKSSYNKSAWDIAKDELDAAGSCIKSNIDVRSVLLEFFNEGDGIAVDRSGGRGRMYDGLSDAGSAVVMNLEMNQSASIASVNVKSSPSKKVKKKNTSKKR